MPEKNAAARAEIFDFSASLRSFLRKTSDKERLWTSPRRANQGVSLPAKLHHGALKAPFKPLQDAQSALRVFGGGDYGAMRSVVEGFFIFCTSFGGGA